MINITVLGLDVAVLVEGIIETQRGAAGRVDGRRGEHPDHRVGIPELPEQFAAPFGAHLGIETVGIAAHIEEHAGDHVLALEEDFVGLVGNRLDRFTLVQPEGDAGISPVLAVFDEEFHINRQALPLRHRGGEL